MLQQKTIRDTIFDLISQISPLDQLELDHLNDAKAWIQTGAPIFRIQKPDIPNKHLVSYFVVVDPAEKKLLLVDHKGAQRWLPSGGHVEIDEDPKETVRRECLEELNIQADFLIEEPFFFTVNPTKGLTTPHIDVNFWYVLKGDSSIQYHYDEQEFHGIHWFPYNELPVGKCDPHLPRFIQKLISALTFSL